MAGSHKFVPKDYKGSWDDGPPWAECKHCGSGGSHNAACMSSAERVAPQVTSQVTPQAAAQVTSQVAPQVTPRGPSSHQNRYIPPTRPVEIPSNNHYPGAGPFDRRASDYYYAWRERGLVTSGTPTFFTNQLAPPTLPYGMMGPPLPSGMMGPPVGPRYSAAIGNGRFVNPEGTNLNSFTQHTRYPNHGNLDRRLPHQQNGLQAREPIPAPDPVREEGSQDDPNNNAMEANSNTPAREEGSQDDPNNNAMEANSNTPAREEGSQDDPNNNAMEANSNTPAREEGSQDDPNNNAMEANSHTPAREEGSQDDHDNNAMEANSHTSNQDIDRNHQPVKQVLHTPYRDALQRPYPPPQPQK